MRAVIARNLVASTLACLSVCLSGCGTVRSGVEPAAVPTASTQAERVQTTYSHRTLVHEFEHATAQVATPEESVQVFPPLTIRGSGGVAGTFRSMVAEAASPFRELVPSWNIDASASTLIDVRVRHADDQSWSPWLRLGRAGEPSANEPEPTRRWEHGKVAVDLIEASVDLDAWQYRLTVAGEGEASVRRIVMVLTSPLESEAPRPKPSAMEIRVPFRSQMTQREDIAGRICSPTSMTMVLASHGQTPSVLEVANRAFDPDFDIYGNWPRNVQTGYEFGIEGYVSRVNSWTEVERHFQAGRPLIASIRVRPGELDAAPYPDTAGHLIVVRGFDGRGGVHVSDPAVQTPALGELVYPMADLEKVWFERGAGTCYVLLPGNS